MTITAMAASLVAMNWTNILSGSHLTNTIDTIVEIDRQTRRHAIANSVDCQLKFDRRKKHVEVTRWVNGREFIRTTKYNRTTVVVFFKQEQSELTYTSQGSSPSYLLEISTADKKKTRWLLIAGGTGQHHLFDNENDATKLWDSIQSTGINAG